VHDYSQNLERMTLLEQYLASDRYGSGSISSDGWPWYIFTQGGGFTIIQGTQLV
jgi:hypothetical protein